MTCSPKPINNEFLVGTYKDKLISTVSVSRTDVQICNVLVTTLCVECSQSEHKALFRLSHALKLVNLSCW